MKAKNSIRNLARLDDIGADRIGSFLLDKNERTTPYGAEVVGEIFGKISPEELSRYPDQSVLYEKLAPFLGIDVSQLLLVPGSDSGLKYIFDVFVEKEDEVVHLDPTYGMIPVYIEMFGAKSKTVSFSTDLELNTTALADQITQKTKLVVLANPNQPTGTVIKSMVLRSIIERSQELGSLCVIDEAYIEFSEEESSISMVEDYSNLIVMRTFSKAWGLAGIRLGYLVSRSCLIDELKKVKPLLDINIFAIKAAECLIRNYDEVRKYIEDVKRARQRAIDRLETAGILSVGSHGNFLHVHLPKEKNEKSVIEELLRDGYRVRTADGTSTVLDGCIRFTVGDISQVDNFLNNLIKCFRT